MIGLLILTAFTILSYIIAILLLLFILKHNTTKERSC